MQMDHAIAAAADQPDSGDQLGRLADQLERAEFVTRIPALQLPWGEAKHPLLDAYMRAARAAAYSEPPAQIDLGRAEQRQHDCEVALEWRLHHREQGGLRRCVDVWAWVEKARRDAECIRQRRWNQQFCVIDGVAFPVSQTPPRKKRKEVP